MKSTSKSFKASHKTSNSERIWPVLFWIVSAVMIAALFIVHILPLNIPIIAILSIVIITGLSFEIRDLLRTRKNAAAEEKLAIAMQTQELAAMAAEEARELAAQEVVVRIAEAAEQDAALEEVVVRIAEAAEQDAAREKAILMAAEQDAEKLGGALATPPPGASLSYEALPVTSSSLSASGDAHGASGGGNHSDSTDMIQQNLKLHADITTTFQTIMDLIG